MDLSQIFGGKSWYKSLTAWGLVLWVGVEPMVSAACEPDVLLFGATTCAMLTGLVSKIGAAMTVLGVRKAATSPNTT